MRQTFLSFVGVGLGVSIMFLLLQSHESFHLKTKVLTTYDINKNRFNTRDNLSPLNFFWNKQPPSSSPVDNIDNTVTSVDIEKSIRLYFDSWNKRDMITAISVFDDDCIYEDTLYPKPFKGKYELELHLINVASSLPPSFLFVIDQLAVDLNAFHCGVQWHVESNGIPLPFTRGSSMYIFNDDGKITKGFDVPEPVVKSGNISLEVLKASKNFVQEPRRLFALAAWLFYIWFVFFSTLLPGPNILHMDIPYTIKEVTNLSLNYLIIQPLFLPFLSSLPLFVDSSSHPILEVIFNFVLLWSALLFGFLVDGKQISLFSSIPIISSSPLPKPSSSAALVSVDGSSKTDLNVNSNKMLPIVVGMQFLTNAFYLFYLVRRNPPVILTPTTTAASNTTPTSSSESSSWSSWSSSTASSVISSLLAIGSAGAIRAASGNDTSISTIAVTVDDYSVGNINISNSNSNTISNLNTDSNIKTKTNRNSIIIKYNPVIYNQLSSTEKVAESKALPIAIVLLSICSLYWIHFGRVDDYGDWTTRVDSFMTLIKSDRLGSSFLVDMVYYSIFQGWLIDDDMKRRIIVPSSSSNTPTRTTTTTPTTITSMLMPFMNDKNSNGADSADIINDSSSNNNSNNNSTPSLSSSSLDAALALDLESYLNLNLRRIGKYIPFYGLAYYFFFRPPLQRLS